MVGPGRRLALPSSAALALAALAVAGCGGTAGVGVGASDLVPASAPAYVSIDTDTASPQWHAADVLAGKFPDKQKAIDELENSLRRDTKLDWGQDVEPALGKELDVVWLDFENNGDNVVALLQPKDEAAFKRLIAKGNASEKDSSRKLVYESFRGWQVVAESHKVIDRFKQESGSATKMLTDESAFSQSMKRLGSDALVRAYVNGPFLMKLARQYAGQQVMPYLDKAGTLDWIALKLAAKSDGIGLDTIVHGTPGKLFAGVPHVSGFSPKLLNDVPKDALVYLTFHGTKNMLAGLQNNALLDAPEFRQLAQSFREFGPVLEGENALYLRPSSGRSPDIPFRVPEVTFVASPGKGVDGAKVLDRLLERDLGTPPSFATIDGLPARTLSSNGVGLFYANVDGKLVASDLAAGIRGVHARGRGLARSPAFRDAARASGLPGKIHGLLYVDIHSTIPLVEKLSNSRIPAEIGRNLKPLRSAVEYAASRTHELQVTFFLRIK
jgi:hypothetical protein